MGIFSCKKNDDIGVSPYPAGSKPLIRFLNMDPYPLTAYTGETVTFFVDGLQGKDTSTYKFFINQERADVISVVDSAVTVRVPATASGGAGSVLIDGKNFFGPTIQIDGKVSLVQKFGTGTGLTPYALKTIYSIDTTTDNNYIVYGDFTDFNSKATVAKPIGGIAKIDKQGGLISTFSTIGINSGVINTMVYTGSSYIVGGEFSVFDSTDKVSNMTKIGVDGHIIKQTVEVVNTDPTNRPEDDSAIVPLFNGGVTGGRSGGVKNIFKDNAGGYVAIGNFALFDSFYYYRSTVSQFIQVFTNINQFVRVDENGSLDQSYNIDPLTGLTYKGVNGFINGALQLPNGKIIIAGSFTTFNDAPVGGIAMLTDNGTQDVTFNAGGAGADGEVTKVTYNATTHKLLLTGTFKKYNGVDAPGGVLINENGSIDNTFHLGVVGGGVVTYAGQLSSGKIMISGTFTTYDGIYKQGMVFVNPDGSFAYGYNNMGSFSGAIYKMLEVKDPEGNPSVIIVGSFTMVDNQSVGNIAQLTILP